MKREPLLHFLLIGVTLFLLHRAVAPQREQAAAVVITQGVVDDILRQYRGVWNRAPTPAELHALLDAHLRDEMAYREGVALGLDREDALIRRRVRQKFEILAEEEGATGPPDDAALAAYLDVHRDRYQPPPLVGFKQILLPEDNAARDAVLRGLAAGADPAELGRSSLLPARIAAMPLDLVARDFGADFAAAVAAVPLGTWSEPVASSYGTHLIRVSARTVPGPPSLDALRAAVARDWEADRRARATEATYARLRAKYPVVIEATLPDAARP